MDITSRPSSEHYLSILFPVAKSRPRLTWLHCPVNHNNVQVPNTALHLFPEGHDANRTTIIQHDIALNPNRTVSIHVSHREHIIADALLPNRSILAVMSSYGIPSFDWRGPLMIHGTFGPQQQRRSRDINLTDFSHAVNHLCYESSPHRSTTAVRINCLGDQTSNHAPLFEAVTIPHTHPIFLLRDDAPDPSLPMHGRPFIPARVGRQLLTLREPHDPTWEKNDDDSVAPATNALATCLHLSCDDDETWGQAASPWPSDDAVGSVLVARLNREPLDFLEVETLARFCQAEVAPRLEAGLPRDEVLAAVTEQAYRAFARRWSLERAVVVETEMGL